MRSVQPAITLYVYLSTCLFPNRLSAPWRTGSFSAVNAPYPQCLHRTQGTDVYRGKGGVPSLLRPQLYLLKMGIMYPTAKTKKLLLGIKLTNICKALNSQYRVNTQQNLSYYQTSFIEALLFLLFFETEWAQVGERREVGRVGGEREVET